MGDLLMVSVRVVQYMSSYVLEKEDNERMTGT